MSNDKQTDVADLLSALMAECKKIQKTQEALCETFAQLGGKASKTRKQSQPAPTVDDVRQALTDLCKDHGRDAAIEIVKQFANGKPKVSAIPVNEYAKIIAACDSKLKEAA